MTAPNAPSVHRLMADAIEGILPVELAGERGKQYSNIGANAALIALKASQPDHLVHFGIDGWTMQHSMECRLEGRLFECTVNAAAEEYFSEAEDTPPFGWRFVVALEDGGLVLVEPVCKICGCTQSRACPKGCSWCAPSVCSECAARAETGCGECGVPAGVPCAAHCPAVPESFASAARL